MTKYECTICGFIYNSAEGNEELGIAPGTTLIDLPASYKCPVCGIPKSGFKRKL